MWTRLPTCLASRQSRATIDSSATAGHPPSPSSAETSPSCIWAPSVRRGSWACWATTPSKALTYSSARRMRTGSQTHRPSSEKKRTCAPEFAMAPSSARCRPSKPSETAPTGRTSQYPASSPRCLTCSTTPAESWTGVVLAIALTHVYPPAAAAWDPVRTVSASSAPGSRRCVCGSTSPGRAISPATSTTRAPPASMLPPTAAMRPPRTWMSPAFPPRSLAPLKTYSLTRSPARAPEGGTGRPCARTHRWPPARSRRSGRSRPRRRRLPALGSSARDA